MKVTIEYHDTESLTVEEIVKQVHTQYGKQAKVEVMPESMMAYDLIYHGLAMLMTHEQVSLLYDNKLYYQSEVQKLRNKVLSKVTDILDQVVVDVETKVV